jgi:hypothetical protein
MGTDSERTTPSAQVQYVRWRRALLGRFANRRHSFVTPRRVWEVFQLDRSRGPLRGPAISRRQSNLGKGWVDGLPEGNALTESEPAPPFVAAASGPLVRRA